MKHYSAIILLVFLTGCFNSNDKSTDRTEKDRKKYRSYDFEITIDVEHSGKDYKDMINRKYYRLEKNNKFMYHDDKLLEHVIYAYRENKKNGINVFDKVAIKTLKYHLSRQQLDTIYSMTTKLYHVDTLNLTNDTIRQDILYDGYKAEIVLNIPNARYKINLVGCSDANLVKRYQKLLLYIENIKKKVILYSGDKKSLIDNRL